MRPRPRDPAALALVLSGSTARAQHAPPRGWALDRFEPAPAGDPFFVAEHPGYAPARPLAAALTLSHALSPLVLRREYTDGSTRDDAIVSGMLTGHLSLAGSFLHRVGLHLSLPLSLAQLGAPDPTMATPLAPSPSVSAGDLRVGARVRVVGDSDRTPFSLHLGAVLWLPTGATDRNTGDGRDRFEARLALAGRIGVARWAFGVAFASRREIDVGSVRLGDALHFTAGLGASLLRGRLHVGIESAIETTVRALPSAMGGGSAAFTRDAWGGEALLGARVHLRDALSLGAAAGFGFEQAGGTPAARFILSAQYALPAIR